MHALPSSEPPARSRIPHDWRSAAPAAMGGLVVVAILAWAASQSGGRELGGPGFVVAMAAVVVAITAWIANRAMRKAAWRAFAEATFAAVAGGDASATWFPMKGDLAAVRAAAAEPLGGAPGGQAADGLAEAMAVDPGSRDKDLGRLATQPSPMLLIATATGYSLWLLPDPMARAYPAAERLAGDRWDDVNVVSTRFRIYQTSRAVGREPVIWIGRRHGGAIDLMPYGWVAGPTARTAAEIARELDERRSGTTGVWPPMNAARRSSNRFWRILATLVGTIVGSVVLAWLVLFVITRLP